MRKACGYIRVSTDDQTELSPDSMKRLILDYAKKNNIYIGENDFFCDLGISGRHTTNRDGFHDMIAYCKSKEHPYDIVLLWKFSRFARNQEESIVYKNLLKKMNVDVISISEPLPEGPIGTLVERIFEWMDEYYSINLSVEVKRGMTENAMRGGYNAKPPFGYKKIKGEKVPVIDKGTEPLVRRIFSMFMDDNIQPFRIAKILNSEGLKSSGGGNFCGSYIISVLDNPFYAGKVRWGIRKYDENGRLEEYNYKDAIVADAEHEPYFSNEYFEKVQTKLHASNTLPSKLKQRTSTAHYLTGVMKCAECGHSMTSKRQNKKSGKSYQYFFCWGHEIKVCDHTQYTAAGQLENLFIQGLEAMIDEKQRLNNSEKEKGSTDTSFYEKQLKSLDAKENRLREAYMAGIDTLEEYKQAKDALTEQRAQLLSKLKTAEENSPAAFVRKIQNLIDTVCDPDVTIENKNVAVKSMFEKIVYSKEKNIFDFFLK